MKTKIKKPTYERAETLTLDEVFPHIEARLNDPEKIYRVLIGKNKVNVQSLRLRTFYHTGTECPCCPNKASFFAVERSYGRGEPYHLNLYGIDDEGKEILFTHDHILSRGLGGEDVLQNTRTMCGPCNFAKGDLENKLGNHFATKDPKKKLSPEELIMLQQQIDAYKPQQKVKNKL